MRRLPSPNLHQFTWPFSSESKLRFDTWFNRLILVLWTPPHPHTLSLLPGDRQPRRGRRSVSKPIGWWSSFSTTPSRNLWATRFRPTRSASTTPPCSPSRTCSRGPPRRGASWEGSRPSCDRAGGATRTLRPAPRPDDRTMDARLKSCEYQDRFIQIHYK